MNLAGIILGVFSAFAIGMGFVWVIRFEYYVGAHLWKWVAFVGPGVCSLSLFMPNFMLSALVGILGGSITWGALELPHQSERVEHGLFRAHPERDTRPRLVGGHHDHSEAKPGLGKWWSF